MDKLEVIKEWFVFSDRDLASAQHLHTTMHPVPIELVCYLCQQSAEKALKAFLIYSDVMPDKIHNLTRLKEKSMKFDVSFTELSKECSRLTPYSSQPRYPNEIEITEGDALLALQDAEKVNAFVKSKILKPKNISMCGIDCDACSYKIEGKCEGCRISAAKGECVWGGRCELHDCAAEQKLPHCGKCKQFPCAKLEEWASSENPERIDNLKKMNEETT